MDDGLVVYTYMSTRHRLVLLVSILASGVAFLDGSIVNVALPAMQRSLGGGLFLQQWVVDAYALSLGALILIAGSLTDLFGRKRILTYGLIGFLITSLACAVAPTADILIIARGLQGIAGALLVPCSLALIISTFSGASQARAIGMWTGWTGISFVVGPLLGGLLIGIGSWRYIFAINVIPILLTLWLLGRVDVEEKRTKAKVDVLGAILCAAGLGGPVFGLIEQPRLGWGDPLVYVSLGAGLILFAAFLVHEKRTQQPMLPFSLFRHHNFTVGNLATGAIYASLSANTLVLVLFLQQVGNFSALAAGMATLPITLILLGLSTRFGSLSATYGPRIFMAAGPMIMALSSLVLARTEAHVHYWSVVFPGVVLFGLGLAITVAPLTSAILGDVSSNQAGIASAVNNAVARVAGLLAVALVGALLTVRFDASLDTYLMHRHGMTTATVMHTLKTHPMDMRVTRTLDTVVKRGAEKASVDAFHGAILASGGLLLVGGLISAVGIRNPKTNKETAKSS